MNDLVFEGVGQASVARARGQESKAAFKGVFEVVCTDKDGNFKWKDKFSNGVADVGINKLLDVFFGATVKFATWYMGLIDSGSFTGLSAGDTLASHAGWTEATGYTVAAGATQRGTWTPAAASGKAVSNTVAVAFTMTGGATIKGFHLCSDQLKATTTGTIWATALFATGDQVVANSDILNVTYTISAA